MIHLLATSDLPTLFAAPAFAASTAIWAELLGVPVAWLRLRHTEVWAQRSRKARAIDLLALYSGRITTLSAIFGGVVGAATWLGTAFA